MSIFWIINRTVLLVCRFVCCALYLYSSIGSSKHLAGEVSHMTDNSYINILKMKLFHIYCQSQAISFLLEYQNQFESHVLNICLWLHSHRTDEQNKLLSVRYHLSTRRKKKLLIFFMQFLLNNGVFLSLCIVISSNILWQVEERVRRKGRDFQKSKTCLQSQL